MIMYFKQIKTCLVQPAKIKTKTLFRKEALENDFASESKALGHHR